MRKMIALVLLVVTSCFGQGRKVKPRELIPPAELHGQAMVEYGCRFQRVSTLETTGYSVWILKVNAKYGPNGKHHFETWEKEHGIYQLKVQAKVTAPPPEVSSGRVSAAVSERGFDFSPINKACAEWKETVKTALSERK